jgi:hypothetical protein
MMRIYGPNGTTIGTTGGNAKRTSSTGFSHAAGRGGDPRADPRPPAAGEASMRCWLQGVEEDRSSAAAFGAAGKGALDVWTPQDRACCPAISTLHR